MSKNWGQAPAEQLPSLSRAQFRRTSLKAVNVRINGHKSILADSRSSAMSHLSTAPGDP
ncbi:hypothetical protein MLP_40300 [Microlunatus phosphovorus NM-1]|uniref:Uncharacterized protein n=1 Tax=Microlunatus phosphovorus (strain ATCC 700054 / DSM 10555 / JCM 9379 / NBRC 101784 / NCIMB 13414 / VKM Ac-1990 / NM-1) TaxID=1032480 RepID=F5XR22_MICPN|nr:hypothetical protein MLP_40300 [Microlunatus phosphovorus NM-1]